MKTNKREIADIEGLAQCLLRPMGSFLLTFSLFMGKSITNHRCEEWDKAVRIFRLSIKCGQACFCTNAEWMNKQQCSCSTMLGWGGKLDVLVEKHPQI